MLVAINGRYQVGPKVSPSFDHSICRVALLLSFCKNEARQDILYASRRGINYRKVVRKSHLWSHDLPFRTRNSIILNVPISSLSRIMSALYCWFWELLLLLQHLNFVPILSSCFRNLSSKAPWHKSGAWSFLENGPNSLIFGDIVHVLNPYRTAFIGTRTLCQLVAYKTQKKTETLKAL